MYPRRSFSGLVEIRNMEIIANFLTYSLREDLCVWQSFVMYLSPIINILGTVQPHQKSCRQKLRFVSDQMFMRFDNYTKREMLGNLELKARNYISAHLWFVVAQYSFGRDPLFSYISIARSFDMAFSSAHSAAACDSALSTSAHSRSCVFLQQYSCMCSDEG
jgi:hypothetical protein